VSDLLIIAGAAAVVVAAWLGLGAMSAARPVSGVSFWDRATALCFITSPIFIAIALVICGLPASTLLPAEVRVYFVTAVAIAFAACLFGGMFVLWELSKGRPSLQRLWKIAQRSRDKNLESA